MAELTPLEWVHRLEDRLKQQREHAQFYDRYYAGEHELAIVRREYDEIFGPDELDPPRTNVSAVGVDAAAERLQVTGFRIGDDVEEDEDQVDDGDQGDDDPLEQLLADDGGPANELERRAEVIWHRNDLDVMEQISNVESLAQGNVFALVWPDRDGDAVISIESAEQMVVARRQEPPYDVVAALKLWVDEWTAEELATLYVPAGICRFRARTSSDTTSTLWTPNGTSRLDRWVERDPVFTPAPRPWRDKLVPVVEQANRARLLRPPQSDLVNVAPLADTHAKILADLVVAASFGAVPIRTATGIELERDKDGKLVRRADGSIRPPFDVRADRAMVSEREKASFGTLPAADLAGYVSALDMILRELRIITRVPQHYYGEGASSGQSGETLKSAEGSLVRRVNGIAKRFGLTWRQVMSLALQLETPGMTGQVPVRARWADTETRVESALIDGAGKLKQMELPLEIILLEHLKYPPELVRRAVAMRDRAQQQANDILAALRVDAVTPTPDPDRLSVPAA